MKTTSRPKDAVADALKATLISPNECDRNSEAANVVDALFFIGRALHRLAEAVERQQSGNEPRDV